MDQHLATFRALVSEFVSENILHHIQTANYEFQLQVASKPKLKSEHGGKSELKSCQL